MAQHYLTCLTGVSGFEDSLKILQEKSLIVKDFDKYGLYLVKYDKDLCDMKDPDVRKCRGLIIRKSDNKVVCIPPQKSDNINEFLNDVDENWGSVEVEEFVDGTMINIFYHDEWRISTRSCIGGKNRWASQKNFNQMFMESSQNMNFDALDKNCCYTLVLKHQDNRIVKQYKNGGVTLVSVVNLENEITPLNIRDIQNQLGEQNINVDIPEKFTFNTYEEALKSANRGWDKYQDQGYVLKHHGMRSKIRNQAYNYAKNLRGNSNNMFYHYLQLKQQNNIQDYLQFFPEHGEAFDYYKNLLFKMTSNLHQNYISLHVKKTKTINEIPFEYRRLCYDLHGEHLRSGQPTTFYKVINFVNNMDVPLILYTINFNKRQTKTHSSSTDVEQSVEAEAEAEVEQIVEATVA